MGRSFVCTRSNIALTGYEDLAPEYYDPIRHPTSANFRDGSRHLVEKLLELFPDDGGWLCEVGPGKALLPEILSNHATAIDRLILVDSSRSMLRYSRQWFCSGAEPVLGDAGMLPIMSGRIGLLLSSLGDAYNETAFWKEAHRVLRPGGTVLFTTPSHDWALAFRGIGDNKAMMSAEFELSDGRRVRVPSWIHPVAEQVELVSEAGLLVKEVADVPISALKPGRLSPKLVLKRGGRASVVTGYMLTKA